MQNRLGDVHSCSAQRGGCRSDRSADRGRAERVVLDNGGVQNKLFCAERWAQNRLFWTTGQTVMRRWMGAERTVLQTWVVAEQLVLHIGAVQNIPFCELGSCRTNVMHIRVVQNKWFCEQGVRKGVGFVVTSSTAAVLDQRSCPTHGLISRQYNSIASQLASEL